MFIIGVVNEDQTEDGPGCCGIVLVALSYVLLVILFPFSLCCSLKVSYTISTVLLDFLLSVKAAPHERVIRTSQP